MAKVVDFKKKNKTDNAEIVLDAVYWTLYYEGRLVPVCPREITDTKQLPKDTDNHPPFFLYIDQSNGLPGIGCNKKLLFEMSDLEAKKRKIRLSGKEKDWIVSSMLKILTARMEQSIEIINNVEKQVHNAIKSGKIVRMKGTPAEEMTDSELTRWMMDNFLPLQLEHALTEAGSTGYIQVSGKPPYSQADAKEIIEQMTAMAKNPKRGKNG